jgi:hypothetical protein
MKFDPFLSFRAREDVQLNVEIASVLIARLDPEIMATDQGDGTWAKSLYLTYSTGMID